MWRDGECVLNGQGKDGKNVNGKPVKDQVFNFYLCDECIYHNYILSGDL